MKISKLYCGVDGRCQNLQLGLKRKFVPTFWPQSRYIEIFKTMMPYDKFLDALASLEPILFTESVSE